MNLLKKSFTLEGHQTSIALEAEFWDELIKIAFARNITLPNLICEIDSMRNMRPLASSLRIYALKNRI